MQSIGAGPGAAHLASSCETLNLITHEAQELMHREDTETAEPVLEEVARRVDACSAEIRSVLDRFRLGRRVGT